ncbi:hypothetical protein B484DRAFT_410752, partial [Ochromonadaceae sp. CCMP2298]
RRQKQAQKERWKQKKRSKATADGATDSPAAQGETEAHVIPVEQLAGTGLHSVEVSNNDTLKLHFY